MAQTLSLPVLPLDDAVVLPSMVVPLDISAPEARAAIEAAQLAAKAAGPASEETQAQVLLVPRPDGRAAQTPRSFGPGRRSHSQDRQS